MMRIGRKLLQDSRNELAESGFEKSRSRDLLSLLVRANTSQDIPASQRLSDEDVLARKLSNNSLMIRALNQNRGTNVPCSRARK
jgi:hypothetical protein